MAIQKVNVNGVVYDVEDKEGVEANAQRLDEFLEILENSIDGNDISFYSEENKVVMEYSQNSGNVATANIPAATTTNAGVMSVTDKQKVDNIEKYVSSEVAKILEGTDPNAIDSLKDLVVWVEQHAGEVASMLMQIQQNSVKINAEIDRAKAAEKQLEGAIATETDRAVIAEEQLGNAINGVKDYAARVDGNAFSATANEVKLTTTGVDTSKNHTVILPAATNEKAGMMSAEDKREQVKKTELINGDTIVGLSREVYSRQGKDDKATFLARTTAGGTTIGSGATTLKKIGGNILKNIVDGEFEGAIVNRATASYNNGVCKIVTDKTESTPLYGDLSCGYEPIAGHTYYSCLQIYNVDCKNVRVSINGGYDTAESSETNKWVFLSYHGIPRVYSVKQAKIRAYNNSKADENNIYGGNTCYVKNWFAIDLTEIYGAGKEPTKEECDKMFSTMDALPMGLTIANPTSFKSVGYNQFNPSNVLVGKGVENGSVVDKEGSNLAIIECLPCKIGVGENNGYCIHGDFTEGEEKVYLTPLSPTTTEGELYLQELERDVEKGTYVPMIKGYMLVEVPNITNLCVHFLWGEDCDRRSYEPYIVNNIEIPKIAEMSEWGLAGIQTSGTMVQDTIDLENKIFHKRIKSIDLGEFNWDYATETWNVYSYGDKRLYVPKRMVEGNGTVYVFSSLNYYTANRIKNVQYNKSDNSISITSNEGVYVAGEVYNFSQEVVIHKATCTQVQSYAPNGDNKSGNILCSEYTTISRGQCYYGTEIKGIGFWGNGYLAVVDNKLSGKSTSEIKEYLSGVKVYYETIAPEEYPIVAKAAPNYIGSDYGTEQFVGSRIPLVANILFYMRSLVGETRNFFDRLMNALGDDVITVADKIIAAVQQHNTTAEATNIEE